VLAVALTRKTMLGKLLELETKVEQTINKIYTIPSLTETQPTDGTPEDIYHGDSTSCAAPGVFELKSNPIELTSYYPYTANLGQTSCQVSASDYYFKLPIILGFPNNSTVNVKIICESSGLFYRYTTTGVYSLWATTSRISTKLKGPTGTNKYYLVHAVLA